jgi:transcription initiation factor TFIIB
MLIFEAILESGVIRGRSSHVFSAVAVLLTAQSRGRVVSFDQIAKAMGLTRKQLFRPYQMAKRAIGAEAGKSYAILPLSAYVIRLTADLELSEVFCSVAIRLTERYNAIGKDPRGVAAAAVWLVSRGITTQRSVAKVAGITVKTLRNHTRELKKYLVE